MKYQGFDLDPFQIDAVNAINRGASVIVAAPTGAGKTMVAEYAVDKAIEAGKRVVYTAPIKALSNQKFRDFTERHGDKVGIVTGDVTHNRDAPLVIMTTEIFRNCIFDSPELVEDVSYLIFDEVHYISDFERGTVWEETIIFAPKHIQIVALSATIPNQQEFADWISEARDCEVVTVTEHKRPVPLEHHLFHPQRGEVTLEDLKRMPRPKKKKRYFFEDDKFPYNVIDHVVGEKKLPCMVFSFNRVLCERLARDNAHRRLLDKETSIKVGIRFEELAEKYGINDPEKRQMIRRMVCNGVAYHHAGVLPSIKEVVEQLFQDSMIKLLFTTETFALGINMPAAAVIFTGLEKYDGITFDVMKTRDYQQMAGRSGRRGIDPIGHVYSNINPFEFDPASIERLLQQKSEPIISRFLLSYATLLSLLKNVGEQEAADACDRSFAAFQARSKKDRKVIRAEVNRRLWLLKQLNYIVDDELTTKGKLASRVFGYELQITEFYFAGVFERLDVNEIAILLMAVVFESRRGQQYEKLPRQKLQRVYNEADPIIKDLRKAQKAAGIEQRCERLDFNFSKVTQLWVSGEPFDNLRHHTTAAEGDMIRMFRMVLQQVRNLRQILDGDPSTQEKLFECAKRMNRDEVNAEAQLLATL